ncbi:MAG: response regulator transcription factor [Anaerolineae bacterium]
MTDTPPLRLLVVDDHEVIRRGLELCFDLFDDLEYVGGAANGAEAIEKCRELQPDGVLMDIMMPVMNGIDATRQIHELWPHIRVIAFTSLNDEYEGRRMLDAGAVAIIMKVMAIDELRTAIHKAFSVNTS